MIRESLFNSPRVWGLGQIREIIQTPEWQELITFLRSVMGFEYLGELKSIRRQVSEHLDMFFSPHPRQPIRGLSPTWHFLRVAHEQVWAIGYLPKEVEEELDSIVAGGKKLIDDGSPLPVRDLSRAVAYFKCQPVRFTTEIPTFDWVTRVIIEGGPAGSEICFALIEDANAPSRAWDSDALDAPKENTT